MSVCVKPLLTVKDLKEYIKGLSDDCEVLLWDSQQEHFQFIEEVHYYPQTFELNGQYDVKPTLHIIGNGRAKDSKITKDSM